MPHPDLPLTGGRVIKVKGEKKKSLKTLEKCLLGKDTERTSE